MNDDTDDEASNDGTDDDASSEQATAPDAGPPLSLDTVFEVLANRRRRFALYALTDAPDRVVELEALVEEVVTLDAALTGAALTRDRYLAIATDLYHWHLPVLDDVGIVDRDARSGTIRYVGRPGLESWLARSRRCELSR